MIPWQSWRAGSVWRCPLPFCNYPFVSMALGYRTAPLGLPKYKKTYLTSRCGNPALVVLFRRLALVSVVTSSPEYASFCGYCLPSLVLWSFLPWSWLVVDLVVLNLDFRKFCALTVFGRSPVPFWTLPSRAKPHGLVSLGSLLSFHFRYAVSFYAEDSNPSCRACP